MPPASTFFGFVISFGLTLLGLFDLSAQDSHITEFSGVSTGYSVYAAAS